MAESKDPLKPVELRGTPLAESDKRAPASPETELTKSKSRPRARPQLKAAPEPTQAVVRVNKDGVEINLEQAYAEARKAEEPAGPALPRPDAPRLSSAPPPASTVGANRTTAPPPSIPSPSSRIPGVSTRSEYRRPCSFPGMLKVLLPEQSFEPQVFAVRVMEISATGARVETLQLSEELHKILSLAVRYIRLEILIPARERLLISGQLAWMEYVPECSVIGLSFHPPRDDLASLVLPQWRPQGPDDSSFITPPVIDSYPPTTDKTPFTFTGHALDADTIVVRGKTEEYRVPVVGGRFEVTVPLVPGTANELVFLASVGEMSSDPTPVWITHKAAGDDNQAKRTAAGLFREALVSHNGRSLKLKFKGDGKDFIQALRRLEATASQGDTFEMSVEMTGNAETALSALKKGASFPWSGGGKAR